MDDFTNALSALGVGSSAPAPQSSVSPAMLKAVIATESGGNPNAVSPKGAQGVMQVMPATNSDPGFGVTPARDNSEAERSRVGRDYLGALHDRYQDPALAAIAYNMGPGATDQWLQNGGDFKKLPAETQSYVGKVMTHAAVNSRQSSQAAPAPQQAAPVDNDFSAALDALNKAPSAQPTQPTPAQIEQQAANQPRSLIKPGTPVDPHAPISSPAADLTLNQITGLGSTVAGGVAGIGTGLYKLAQTGDVGQAVKTGSDTVNAVQQAGTYQPRTEQGAKMVEQFGSNWNPLSWIPNASQAVGDKAGTALENAGYPAAGAVAKGVGAAAPLALGMGAKSLSSLVKGGADVAEIPRVDPTMTAEAAAKPRYKMGPDGKPVLISEGAPPETVAPVTPNGPAPVPVGAQAAPPVAKPTLAQATPELQQAVSQAQAKGVPVPEDVLARHVEADTLPVPVKLTTGQAAMNPELISNEMNSRGKGQAAPVSPDFYNAQGKALASNLDVLRDKVAPDLPKDLHTTTAGQTLIDQYKAMDAPVRQDISAKYKALEQANGGQFPLKGQDFVASADQALAGKNKTRYLPPEIAGDLSDLRNGGPMTFNDFENLRTTLAAAGRKADRAGDGNASYAINLVRNSLESLPMTGEAANIKPLADAARAAAKNRFDALAADPAYKAAANDTVKAGEPSPLADRFVQNYLINGKGANVKNMKANLAGSDIANQTIAASGLDYLKGVSKADPKTGNFAADAYNKGLKQLGPKMNDIFDPETAQHAQQVGNVAKYTSAQPKGSFVNNSNTTTAQTSPATQAAIASAKGLAEHGTNMAFGGIPVGTGIRKLSEIVGKTKDAKAAAADSKASTDPLAGFKKLSDLPGGRP